MAAHLKGVHHCSKHKNPIIHITKITAKPVFKGQLNITEKVSLHHRFLNMGKMGHCYEKTHHCDQRVSSHESVP